MIRLESDFDNNSKDCKKFQKNPKNFEQNLEDFDAIILILKDFAKF